MEVKKNSKVKESENIDPFHYLVKNFSPEKMLATGYFKSLIESEQFTKDRCTNINGPIIVDSVDFDGHGEFLSEAGKKDYIQTFIDIETTNQKFSKTTPEKTQEELRKMAESSWQLRHNMLLKFLAPNNNGIVVRVMYSGSNRQDYKLDADNARNKKNGSSFKEYTAFCLVNLWTFYPFLLADVDWNTYPGSAAQNPQLTISDFDNLDW